MKFYMLVLALDTTTRRGSMALLRDGALVECEAGDETRAFGERLPGAPVTRDQLTMLALGDNVVTDPSAVETFQLPLVSLDEQLRRAT